MYCIYQHQSRNLRFIIYFACKINQLSLMTLPWSSRFSESWRTTSSLGVLVQLPLESKHSKGSYKALILWKTNFQMRTSKISALIALFTSLPLTRLSSQKLKIYWVISNAGWKSNQFLHPLLSAWLPAVLWMNHLELY